MSSLQEMLSGVIMTRAYEATADVVCAKAAERGISLTNRERQMIIRKLQNKSESTISLRNWRFWDRDDISISIDDSDLDVIVKDFEWFLEEELPNQLPSLIDCIAPEIVRMLRARWLRQYRRQKRDFAAFHRAIRLRWGEALQWLGIVVSIARETGDSAAGMWSEEFCSSAPNLVDVLPRLHARACKTAHEVLVLLEAGCADGAVARWRTLHEVVVVSMVLAREGESLARAYIDHEAVQTFRGAREYRRCSPQLGLEPISDQEFEDLRERRDKVVSEYGKSFDSEFGWAATLIGSACPSFRSIEEAAGIDHLRSHYRMASNNVHANANGVFFQLGLVEEGEFLLAGPSDLGLADPGHAAALSLTQATAALCTLQPNLDSLIFLRVLLQLGNEVGDLFQSARHQLLGDSGSGE